ncbi:MAG TPA: ATP-binding protein [Candidatus Angelobacter sp.]|nr:ATP-binding protein [Candidatus Angelobacter sp.]
MFLICLLLASPVLLNCVAEEQEKPVRRVLIINEVGTSYPLINLMDEGIRAALKNGRYRIEFYREYMETVLFPDQADQQMIRDFYIRKYQRRPPDVIITVGSTPLRFMADAHDKFFSSVPVVFCLPNRFAGLPPIHPEFTGVEGDIAPAATLKAALQLQPDTKHLVVVGGMAPFDRQQQEAVKQQLKTFESRLDILYLTDLAMPSLLQRLKNLPPHTIVLLTALGKDATGTPYISSEVGPTIVAAANAPVFSMSDRFLNHGEVGGNIASALEQGRATGEMVLKILGGEAPGNIQVMQTGETYMFDWRALKRWGFKEENLPPGSIVLNRQPTVWDSYKWYIVTGITLITAQTLLIAALLWQRKRRQRAEADLAQLTSRLMEAQDLERRRIAREIHDDYSQRLALVGIDLQQLSSSVAPEVASQLNELWTQVSELGSDLHSLSHDLHSSTLERLGLVAGAKAFCAEFSLQQGIQVDFRAGSGSNNISADRSLCLFRVLQEALRNIKKHSGATTAKVRLEFADGRVHLSVSDHGKGFNWKTRPDTGGIGIRSMEERVRSLQGQFEIRSRPMNGTRIDVWLPVNIASRLREQVAA